MEGAGPDVEARCAGMGTRGLKGGATLWMWWEHIVEVSWLKGGREGPRDR